MKKILRESKGITLIALVITIIILIILAGVLINLTLGKNGIFKRSKVAKDKYEYAAAKETVDLKILEVQTECIQEGSEFTVKRVADKMGLGEEEAIEIIHYYTDVAKTKAGLTIPESVTGIVVIDVHYPKYKFLIGEISEGNVGVIGASDSDSMTPARSEFMNLDEFEENVIENPDSYTVTLYSNGNVYSKLKVAVGGSVNLPTNVTRKYSTFVGWCLTSNGSSEDILPNVYTPDNSVSLYAIWEEQETSSLRNYVRFSSCSSSQWGGTGLTAFDGTLHSNGYSSWPDSDDNGKFWRVGFEYKNPTLMRTVAFTLDSSWSEKIFTDKVILYGIRTDNTMVELGRVENISSEEARTTGERITMNLDTNEEFRSYQLRFFPPNGNWTSEIYRLASLVTKRLC